MASKSAATRRRSSERLPAARAPCVCRIPLAHPQAGEAPLHATDDSQHRGGLAAFRPRFTLRRLLQTVTLTAFLAALLSQSPLWVLIVFASVFNAGALGLLVALAFLESGRTRIATVAALACFWLNGGGVSVRYLSYWPQSVGFQGISPRYAVVISLFLVWGVVAITAATAYWMAGRISRRADASTSPELDPPPGD